jgi:putative oxidoreductase
LPVNRTLSGPTRDVAILVARLLLGSIMFAHGYQKLMIDGLGRTTQGFESMSIPVAIVSAAFVTVIEVVGGVLVILGALLTVVAAFYLVVMVGAAVFVHISHGIFVGNNGWELVGAIAALLLALAAVGSGRFGVDHLIRSRQAPVPTPAAAAAAASAAGATAAPQAWPSRPPARHDYAARASAFTELLPRVSGDVPAPHAGPAGHAKPAVSGAHATPALSGTHATPAASAAHPAPLEPAVSAGPLPVRRPRRGRPSPSPSPTRHAEPPPPPAEPRTPAAHTAPTPHAVPDATP